MARFQRQPRVKDGRVEKRRVTPSEARAIAVATQDAYSCPRYRNWEACARLLAQRGCTAAEIETVLRSKWMRWAGDLSGKDYGRVSSRDLATYLDSLSPLQVDALFNEVVQ